MAWGPDELDAAAFQSFVAPLFESAPRFLRRLAMGRPDGSWEALFTRAEQTALVMPIDEQVELIDAHPRIGAPPDSVSAHSFVEQGYEAEGRGAGTEPGPQGPSPEEEERRRIQAQLDRLNAAYESIFGFRFVVFVAGRPRSAIVPVLESALGADPDLERERALRDVVAIARDRAMKSGLMTEDGASDGTSMAEQESEAGP